MDKRKKGIALLFVLATIFIVAVLGNVVLSIILSQSRLTHHQVSRIQAYYAGQAGMNLALENLRTGTWSYDTSYAINCTSSNCTSTVLAINRITDTDIRYEVLIVIGQQGVGGPNNTTPISVTATYTYTP